MDVVIDLDHELKDHIDGLIANKPHERTTLQNISGKLLEIIGIFQNPMFNLDIFIKQLQCFPFSHGRLTEHTTP